MYETLWLFNLTHITKRMKTATHLHIECDRKF
jgi:hypothetical protein